MSYRPSPVLVLLAATLAAGPVLADELQQLRQENARLRARVEALAAENARLRTATEGPLAAALARAAAEAVETTPAGDGRTTLRTRPSLLDRSSGPETRHWMALRGERPPTAPAPADAPVRMVIEAAASRRAYRSVAALTLVADGATHDCRVVDYAAESTAAPRGGSAIGEREIVTVELPGATLAALAHARTVEGRLGPTRFQLTPSQLADIQAFRTRLTQ